MKWQKEKANNRAAFKTSKKSVPKELQIEVAKLEASKFRWLNEQLYTVPSTEARRLFEESPELFAQYHQGFSHQVTLWPVNPVDKIIAFLMGKLENRPKALAPLVIADMGCGEGKIYDALQVFATIVHSFDLLSTKPHITACDIAKVIL